MISALHLVKIVEKRSIRLLPCLFTKYVGNPPCNRVHILSPRAQCHDKEPAADGKNGRLRETCNNPPPPRPRKIFGLRFFQMLDDTLHIRPGKKDIAFPFLPLKHRTS